MIIGRKAHTKTGTMVRLFDNSCDYRTVIFGPTILSFQK